MSIPFYREERNERINSTAWREFLSLLHFQSEQEVNEDNWVILKIRIPSMILINSFYFLKFHLPNYILLPPPRDLLRENKSLLRNFPILGTPVFRLVVTLLFSMPCPLSLSDCVSWSSPLAYSSCPGLLLFCDHPASLLLQELFMCCSHFLEISPRPCLAYSPTPFSSLHKCHLLECPSLTTLSKTVTWLPPCLQTHSLTPTILFIIAFISTRNILFMTFFFYCFPTTL